MPFFGKTVQSSILYNPLHCEKVFKVSQEHGRNAKADHLKRVQLTPRHKRDWTPESRLT